ncbi:MAG: T9SS type A sorting domain-containing protein [Bacteroidales bacterium]|nr:T9SS type A sorting domain-containing protein [Bacteroidales bacterium]
MRAITIFSIILILISYSSFLGAQQISVLDYNPAIKKQLVEKNSFKASPEFPPFPENNLFFDDFSYYRKTVHPNPGLWADRYAFINQTFADSCISIGVATLDAIDQFGNIYAVNDYPTPSDTLTSRTIDLTGQANGIFFSFFVQGGGKGGAPKEKDSLIVEFFNNETEVWQMVWYSGGYKSNTFQQVIIPIEEAFFSDSFMFRFRNYTSLVLREAPGDYEGSLGNTGLWHIDYVQVRVAPDSNAVKEINDVAITSQLMPAFENYCSLPYNHFEVASSYKRSLYPLSVRTYFPSRSIDIKVSRNYESYNIYKGISELQDEARDIQNNQPPFVQWDYFDNFVFLPNYYYYSNQLYGHYQSKAYIVSADVPQYRWNDTIVREEVFRDYYAHDDGTAEYGFGMPGEGGYGARLAVMFNLYTFNFSDTLTAIDIHFPHSRNNAHKNVGFTPCVWTTDGNNPGDLLYPSGDAADWPVYYPDTTLGIGSFMRIPISDSLLVNDTIFVGLVQYSNDFLNIGYDVNNDSKARIRTNKGAGWFTPANSIPAGSLMIRPVFGHKVYTSIKENLVPAYNGLSVFPNPARENIYIMPDNFDGRPENYRLELCNVLGRVLLRSNQLPENLDISFLGSGIYVVRVVHSPTNTVYVQKFLKAL